MDGVWGPPQLVQQLLQLLALAGGLGCLGEYVHVQSGAPILLAELTVQLNKILAQLDLLEDRRGEPVSPGLSAMECRRHEAAVRVESDGSEARPAQQFGHLWNIKLSRKLKYKKLPGAL